MFVCQGGLEWGQVFIVGFELGFKCSYQLLGFWLGGVQCVVGYVVYVWVKCLLFGGMVVQVFQVVVIGQQEIEWGVGVSYGC